MSARVVTCHELTKNDADLKKMRELFFAHRANHTSAFVLFPWLPSSARKLKKEAATALFNMICSYVEKRRHSEPTNDAIDTMLAGGDTNERIVQVSFTLTVLQGIKPNSPQDIMTIFFVAGTNPGIVCESRRMIHFTNS